MGGCGLQRRPLAPGSRARSVAGGGCSPPRRPRPTVMNRVVPPPPLRGHTVGTRWRERQWAAQACSRLIAGNLALLAGQLVDASADAPAARASPPEYPA